MIHSFYFSGKKFKVETKKMGFFGKFIGLMFKSSSTKNLLFEFDRNVGLPIHSFFVFFPFLAIWVDGKDKVIDFKFVRPFCFSVKPKKDFRKLIELPINEKNEKIISIFSKNI
jgi:uncharacterized membrane protein (UPF0127 family)